MSFPNMAHLASHRYWTVASSFFIGSVAISACVLGYLLWKEISKPQPERFDISGAFYDVGYEFNRFLISAERNESPEKIRLRADIYLSRVIHFRDAPIYERVRALMPEQQLSELFQSIDEIAALVENLYRPGGRDALLAYLRPGEKPMRAMIVQIAARDREIWIAGQAARQGVMTRYIALIVVLLVAFVIARIVIGAKLRDAGRAIAAQLVTREGILGSVDAAILGLNDRGEVLYSNRNALELIGPRARRGTPLRENLADEGGLLAEIAALLYGAQDKESGELHAIRKVRINDEAGTRHYVIRASSAQPSVHGYRSQELASVIVAITDVTTEEEAALRREEYDARLGEASRILAYAAMSGGIVHEISQPLAAMRNYVYTLNASIKLGKSGAEQQVIANLLSVEIDRAIEVVRNIRQMGPQGTQDIGMCDVHEVIAQSVRLVSLGSNPPPAIEVTPSEGHVMIAGTLPVIGQVIVNLLKNALSASAAAGRSGARVEITLLADTAEIAVADYGSGVSEDAANSMFMPFTKSSRGGMGLGLAICQRIATNLGGSLSWENSRNEGAIFRFKVPLARQEAPAVVARRAS